MCPTQPPTRWFYLWRPLWTFCANWNKVSTAWASWEDNRVSKNVGIFEFSFFVPNFVHMHIGIGKSNVLILCDGVRIFFICAFHFLSFCMCHFLYLCMCLFLYLCKCLFLFLCLYGNVTFCSNLWGGRWQGGDRGEMQVSYWEEQRFCKKQKHKQENKQVSDWRGAIILQEHKLVSYWEEPRFCKKQTLSTHMNTSSEWEEPDFCSTQGWIESQQ